MSMIQAASDSDNLKHKLTMLILGAIVGAGTYQIAKNVLQPHKGKKKTREDVKKSKEIER